MKAFANDRAIDTMERRKLVLAFCYTFLAVGAYVVSRAAANALFLARIGPSSLPLMYLVSACTVGCLALLFMRFASIRSLKRVILSNLIMLSSFSVALCLLVQELGSQLFLLGSIYVLAEVAGCLLTIQYGFLVNELFAGNPRHHYITGWLGAAATLAGITFGAAIAFEVREIGTLQLLYVAAGMECLAMIPIAFLPRSAAEVHGQATDANFEPESVDAMQPDSELAALTFGDRPVVTKVSGIVSAARRPHVRGIATVVGVAVVVTTLVEFQWKSAVSLSFTSENEIAVYFGIFEASVNLLTGAFQLLLTGKLLNRLGTSISLLIFPAALLVAVLGVLTATAGRAALVAMTLAKGCDVLKRSVNEPAILMLYATLSKGRRRQAITLVAGIVKPCCEAIAALLILALVSSGYASLMVIGTLALIGIWLCVALKHVVIS